MTDNPGGVDLGSAFATLRLDGSAMQADFKKAQKSLADGVKDFSAQISGLGTEMVKLSAPVTAFFGVALKAAADSNKEFEQLKAVLTSTQGVAGVTQHAAIDLAAAFEQTTNYTKEATLSAENMLLTFTNLKSNVFPDATKIVLDMSTALGQDLKSSAIQLGKALNEPIKGVTALQRVGVQFTDAQKQQIKTLVESGHMYEAQKLILKELQTEFGGSAEAAVAADGGFTQLQNTVHDLVVEVGNALMPTLHDLVGNIKPIIEQAIEWIKANPQLIAGIGLAAVAFTALGGVLIGLGTVIGAIGALFEFVLSPIGLVVAGVAALGIAFQTNFLGIRDLLHPILSNIGEGLQWLQMSFGVFVDTIKKFGIVEAIKQAFGIGADSGDSWVEGVIFQFTKSRDFAVAATGVIRDAFLGIVSAIQNVGTDLQTAWDAFQRGHDITEALGDFFGLFANNLLTAFGAPKEVALQVQLDVQNFSMEVRRSFGEISDFVNNEMLPRFRPVVEFFKGLWEAVRPGVEDFGRWWLETGLPKISESVGKFYDFVIKPLVGLLAGLWTSVADSLGSFFTWMKQYIPDIQTVVDNLFKAVESLVNMVDKALTNLGTLESGFGDVQKAANGKSFGDIASATFNAIGQEIFHHADGSTPKPGWNMFGENGPELAYLSNGGGQTFTAPQTQSILNNSGATYDFSGMQVSVQANSFSEGQAAADGWWNRMENLHGRQG
jgi:hypothetical protein